MTTKEIANKLVAYCREGKWSEAIDELYSDDIVAIEPEFSQGPVHIEGLEAKKKKDEMFSEVMEEIHELRVSEPVVAGSMFSISMYMDSTMKGMERMAWEEICLYQVKNGKIIREQFFYDMPE